MVWDSVEPEDLVEAEPQEILHQRLLRAFVGFACKKPIERGLPADNAINKFLAKAAIGRGNVASAQLGLEQIFDEIAFAPVLEDLDRNFSWILAAHKL